MKFPKLKIKPGFKQFLIKTAVFLVLFIAVSLVIGQKIVASKLLYGFDIFIYGGMGYILLFSIAGFLLLYRNKLLEIASYGYKLRDFALLILSFILVSCFYVLELNIDNIEPSISGIILVHLLFLSMLAFLVLGVYGLRFIINFVKKFKKELAYFLIFGIVSYSLMYHVWKLWPYFSLVVTKAVAFLLKLISANFRLISSDTIIVNSFSAKIAAACSGVYSIFLFTALYLFIVLVDWKKINKTKACLLFIPALLGAFIVNIIRVFILFIVGGYVSRDIALGLYHSYTGMIFFLIYFALFWLIFYKWVKDEPSFLSSFFKDSLYRNSFYLMLNTLIMSVLGFAFWIVAARLFSTEQVGLTTAIISAMGIITSFSLLGLNAGLIRFLPKSERKNNKINTVFTLISIVTIIVASIFLLSIDLFASELLFIKQNIILSFIFIIFMVFASLSSLIESVFIAYRKTGYILLKNSIFSALKIGFLYFFVSLGAYGLFSSWMVALIIGFLISFIILIIKFSYSPKFTFYDEIIKKIGKYSFENYVAGFIGGLSGLLLPLIIISKLSPEISAYYYIAMMIANIIFIIPYATSNSLFAEGSNNEKEIRKHIKKAVKIISLLLIPLIIAVLFFGKYILLFFGLDYASGGFRFLQILSVSGVFIAINSVFGTILRINNKIRSLIVISAISSAIILGLSYYFIGQGLGLAGIGYAWLISQAIISLVYLIWGMKIGRKS